MSPPDADLPVTCDTSVLVPALVGWHPEHEAMRAALATTSALTAHTVVETFSVLTRLPAPHRIRPDDAAAAIRALPWPVIALPADQHVPLVTELAQTGARGGATYDALVAATARHHQHLLLTRDVRARATYDRLRARYRVV